MKRIFLCLCSAIALAAIAAQPAVAQPANGAPPGNSAINQYLETIPSLGGNSPTSSIHRSGSHSIGGAAGTGSGGQGGGGSSSVPAPTQRSLAARGPAGREARDIAVADAPRHPKAHSASSNGAGPDQAPASPLHSVISALTGSSTNGGGLGVWLPVLLVVVLLGGGSFALVRRRARRAE
jgi:hypothetical protein